MYFSLLRQLTRVSVFFRGCSWAKNSSQCFKGRFIWLANICYYYSIPEHSLNKGLLWYREARRVVTSVQTHINSDKWECSNIVLRVCHCHRDCMNWGIHFICAILSLDLDKVNYILLKSTAPRFYACLWYCIFKWLST